VGVQLVLGRRRWAIAPLAVAVALLAACGQDELRAKPAETLTPTGSGLPSSGGPGSTGSGTGTSPTRNTGTPPTRITDTTGSTAAEHTRSRPSSFVRSLLVSVPILTCHDPVTPESHEPFVAERLKTESVCFDGLGSGVLDLVQTGPGGERRTNTIRRREVWSFTPTLADSLGPWTLTVTSTGPTPEPTATGDSVTTGSATAGAVSMPASPPSDGLAAELSVRYRLVPAPAGSGRVYPQIVRLAPGQTALVAIAGFPASSPVYPTVFGPAEHQDSNMGRFPLHEDLPAVRTNSLGEALISWPTAAASAGDYALWLEPPPAGCVVTYCVRIDLR
jgi:hypothetical protein